MRYLLLTSMIVIASAAAALSQSAHKKPYSESTSRYDTYTPKESASDGSDDKDGVIRVNTDLVMVPVRVMSKKGRPVADLTQKEFRIFENGEEQEIAYFATEESPVTVALMLDLSYSTVFKLPEIQAAAKAFIELLKPDDKVMVVAFDERVRILCQATNDRRALRYAIEAARVGSGTKFYGAMDQVLNDQLAKIEGRKAIVVLTDGVDTASTGLTAGSVLRDVEESDVLIYPIQYDTYDDVQRNRRKDAEVRYDEDDRKYVVDTPQGRGERPEDYAEAAEFLRESATRTGGRVYKVRSTTNLSSAFAQIADELRKSYTLGYYPSQDRSPGQRYYLRVRIYRPDLIIRARETYLRPKAAE